MDRIPDQVEFQYVLDEKRRPDPALVMTRNLKVLTDIEGRLLISVNGRHVFDEDGVLLMELGVDLVNWLGEVNAGTATDFAYFSMDFADGPLLRFSDDGSHWTIDSPWLHPPEVVRVHKEVLVEAIAEFVTSLAARLRSAFGIDITDPDYRSKA